MSATDQDAILSWASKTKDRLSVSDVSWVSVPRIKNLPPPVETFLAGALALSKRLKFQRQQDFARCAP